MNCKNFQDLLFLFQADELTASEREVCQTHLNGCSACAGRLEEEEMLLRVVKSKLTRTPAPPGFETRIRAALRAEDRGRVRVPWFRAPWFAATAAAALLIAVLLPTLIGDMPGSSAGSVAQIHEDVMVVDLDCDRAGKGIEWQRRCTHPSHINALKRSDGSYWSVSPMQSEFRYLLLDRDARGRKLVVEGESFSGTDTIRLHAVEQLESRLPAVRPASPDFSPLLAQAVRS